MMTYFGWPAWGLAQGGWPFSHGCYCLYINSPFSSLCSKPRNEDFEGTVNQQGQNDKNGAMQPTSSPPRKVSSGLKAMTVTKPSQYFGNDDKKYIMQDIFFDFFRCKKRGVWPQWAALSVSSKSTFLALGGGVLCLAISAPMGFFCYTTCALKCFYFFALLNHMCSMNFVTPLVPQGVCSVSTLLFLHLCSKEFR